jgi:rhamnosyl/mannosyltransferase
LTVPINNSVALAQAAQRLLDEPDLRDRLSVASRDRARREFDHMTMAQRSLEIYKQALHCSDFEIQAEVFRTE